MWSSPLPLGRSCCWAYAMVIIKSNLNWYFHMVTQMAHDWSCFSCSSHVNMSDKAALGTKRDITFASRSPPTLEKQHVIKLEAAAPQLLDESQMWVCQTTQTHLATACVLGMCRASLSTPRCLPLLEHATRSCFPLRVTLHVCFALFCPPAGEPHAFWAAFDGDLGQLRPFKQVHLMLCKPSYCRVVRAPSQETVLEPRAWGRGRMGVLPHVSKQVCWDKHLELSGGWLFRYGPWWA